MEDKKYVTLEELEELFAKEASKRQLSVENEQVPAATLQSPVELFSPLLDQHLYAERLLRKDYQDVDWTKECPFPVSILTYAKLWMNPLVWIEPNVYEDFVLDGRIAVEEYADERFTEIEDIVFNIYEEVILSFADNPIAYDSDMLEVGYTKGMHEWSPLTWDVYSYLYKILDGESLDWKELDKKFYDFIRLRFNLTIIAENRGGKRAAELLKMLQKEWPSIKRWKTNMEKVEEKDIAEFEELLFNGFDDLLEKWDAETPQEATSNTKPAVFEFITEQCRKEGKVEAVEAELRAAAKGTAVAMWKTIRINEALGYLSTKDVAASKIYKALTAYFGDLPYNERNFRDARNKR